MCFFGKGKHVAAAACLKKANYLAPFEWIISYNLGVVHLAAEQYSSAFQCFSAAINLQPTFGKAYAYLAVALSQLEDFDNACAAYDKALELGPEPVTILNYAITLSLNGETKRSKELLKRFDAAVAVAAQEPEADAEVAVQAQLLREALS